MDPSKEDDGALEQDSDDALQDAMEKYLILLEKGEVPDRKELLAEFPHLPEDIGAHFDGLDRLAQLLPHHRTEFNEAFADSASPRRLGDYLLKQQVGRGGMGVVYEAEQLSTQERVAIKMLPMAVAFDPNRIRRFEIEAMAATLIHHPHIVPVSFVGVEEGIHFFAMKFIDGTSLDQLIQQHEPREPADDGDRGFELIARQGAKIAQALHSAHKKGIVHRDVKPGNILLDSNGKIWLTDFGLARFSEQNTTLTAHGAVVGTLNYMSPEQRLGEDVDDGTDIYSLGTTLQAWARAKATNPDGSKTSLPAAFSDILAVATENDRSLRYASAAEFAKDLERFAGRQSTHASAIVLRKKRISWFKKNSSRVMVIAAAASLLWAMFAIQQARSRSESTQQQVSEKENRIAQLEYAQDMQFAFSRILDRPELNRSLLDRHRPKGGQPDLRGVEWHLLDNLSQPSGRQLLGTHDGSANELAVLPNGQIASVGDDGMLRVWDRHDAKQNWDVKVSNKDLNAVAVSPDGETIATGSQIVKLWDVESRTFKQTLTEHLESNFESIAYSPDGQRIAAATRYEGVRVFDKAGKFVGEIESGARHESIAFSADSQCLLVPSRRILTTGAKQGYVNCWDRSLAKTHSEFLPFSPAGGNYTSVATSHDGTFCCLAEEYNAFRIYLHSMATQERLLRLPKRGSKVKSIAISPDDRKVAAGFRDGSIAIWEPQRNETGQFIEDDEMQVHMILAHSGETRCVRFIDNDTVASCGRDGKVIAFKLGRTQAVVSRKFESQIAVAPAMGKDLLAVATQDRLWVLGDKLNVIAEEELARVETLDISFDDEFVALALMNKKQLEIRNASNARLLNTCEFQSFVRDVAFAKVKDSDRNSPELVVLTSDGLLHFMDAANGTVTRQLELEHQKDFPYGVLAFSRNGLWLACGLEENGLYVVNVSANQVEQFVPTKHVVYDLTFVEEDERLAVAHSNSTIGTWDVPSLSEFRDLGTHNTGGVYSVRSSMDGSVLASGGADGAIRLWNLKASRLLGDVHQQPLLDHAMYRFVEVSDERLFVTCNVPPVIKSYNIAEREAPAK